MLLRITMKNTNGFDRKDVFNYFEENPIYRQESLINWVLLIILMVYLFLLY